MQNVIPLWKEVEYFKEYQKKLKGYVGKEKAEYIIKEAVYLISIGTNDFLENYYTMPNRRSQYSVDQYQGFIIGLAENFVKELYFLGARKIALTGLPPMGCLPLERTTNYMNGGGCVESYNIVALSFNSKLSDMITKLNRQLRGISLVPSDPYNILLQMIHRPSSFGIRSSFFLSINHIYIYIYN